MAGRGLGECGYCGGDDWTNIVWMKEVMVASCSGFVPYDGGVAEGSLGAFRAVSIATGMKRAGNIPSAVQSLERRRNFRGY
jgi:hypothetical protein